jgi:hypothetical protein
MVGETSWTPGGSLAFAASAQPLQTLRPILECVQDEGDGFFTAYFGYKRDSNLLIIPGASDA